MKILAVSVMLVGLILTLLGGTMLIKANATLEKLQEPAVSSFPIHRFLYERRTEGEQFEEIKLSSGKLHRMMTWDEALPIWKLGNLLHTERITPDIFVEVRRFPEGVYSIVFGRSDASPYIITRIESGTYVDDVKVD